MINNIIELLVSAILGSAGGALIFYLVLLIVRAIEGLTQLNKFRIEERIKDAEEIIKALRDDANYNVSPWKARAGAPFALPFALDELAEKKLSDPYREFRLVRYRPFKGFFKLSKKYVVEFHLDGKWHSYYGSPKNLEDAMEDARSLNKRYPEQQIRIRRRFSKKEILPVELIT